MKTLIALLISFISLSARAQNYRCLQSGVKHYFINSHGYVRGMRIDSVRTAGTATIYYPYHTPRGRYDPTVSATLDSNGGSWLGKKVIQQADGTFLFDNMWHDTVIIKPQANVGETWIFYRDTTTLYYMANLLSVDTMTVLGSLDSIKKILITARNATGIVTTDPTDSFQIILSKNNGFIQVFDLFTFPYHARDSTYAQGLDYYLDHHAIPVANAVIPGTANAIFSLFNFVNSTIADLYQWSVGDIVEYSVCNEHFDHYLSGCDPVEYYYFDTIVSASGPPGGASYYVNGSIHTYIGPLPTYPGDPSGVPIYATAENNGAVTYSTALLFDTTLMPEEYGQGNIWGYFPNDASYCVTNTLYGTQNNIEITGTQYNPPFETREDPSFYKSPLGLLSTNREWPGIAGGNDVMSSKLIYQVHNGSPCGSLHIPPTSISDIKNGDLITLYPNPARTELTMTARNITSVAITNIIGQTVYNLTANATKVKIDVANLPSGVYFAKINGSEVKKFVKE